MSRLLMFLQDDLLNILCIGLGAHVMVSKVVRRSHWPLRLIFSFLIIMGWMLLTTMPDRNAPNMLMPSIARYTMLLCLNVAAVMFCTEAGFFTALFAGTVGYCVQHFCERSFELVRYAFEIPVLADRALLAVYMLVTLLVYAKLTIWQKGKKGFSDFDRLDSKILLLAAAVTALANIALDMMFYGSNQGGAPFSWTYMRAASALIAFLVLIVSSCHIREAESERRAEIASQLLRAEQARFQQEKAVHDAINIKCHDIRHQIAALGENGYQSSLREIGKLVNVYDSAVKTENAALDLVLSNKSLTCTQNGVTLSCMADGRQLNFMRDEDVYALFGNILDNAMNAVQLIPDEQRRQISLSVHTHSGCVVIEEHNFYEGELLFADGLPQTNQADTANHGFGMQSIRMLTEKYGGDLLIDVNHGIYRLSILIPVSEEQAA